MECLDARLQSFAKAKRVKSSTGKFSVLKWPHLSSFSANPHTLAEAGFYYNPSPAHRDSVKCFICEKELSDWEPGDDPFAIHLEKARGACAWAFVRCYLGGDKLIDSNTPMSPSSKTMEKARLETFGFGWPHDAAKGHGANSRKMAKAGFAYTPHQPGDDTASCFYCGVALSGWDADDNPLDEHRKREAKSGNSCPFLTFISASHYASASTSPKLSKALGRPPSRPSSRKRVVEPESGSEIEGPVVEEESEDEAAPASSRGRVSRQNRSASTHSRASTLTTLPSKTPGSRRSTRTTGTATERSTRATNAPGVEGEDEDEDVPDEESGRKVSKSKSKGKARRTTAKTRSKGKEKDRIEAIEEESEEIEGNTRETDLEADVSVAEKPKRGRGRPLGSGKGKQVTVVTTQKAPVSVISTIDEEVMNDVDSDIEMLPPRPKQKTPSPSTSPQSDVNRRLESDSHMHTQRTKPSSSTKHRAMVEVVVPPLRSRSDKLGRGKRPIEEGNGAPQRQTREASDSKTEGKAKVSRSKGRKPHVQGDSDDDDLNSLPKAPAKDVAESAVEQTQMRATDLAEISTSQLMGSRVAKRNSSSTSEDAGYTTAEHRMDVDDMDMRPVAAKPPSSAPPPNSGAAQPERSSEPNNTRSQGTAALHTAPSGTFPQSQPGPTPQAQLPERSTHPPSKGTARASSRSFARVPSRNGHINDNEVVDVSSSDDDEVLLALPKANVSGLQKGKARDVAPAMQPATLANGDALISSKKSPIFASNFPQGEALLERAAPTPAKEESPRNVLETGTEVEMTDAHGREPESEDRHHINVDTVDEDHSNATPPPHTPSISPRDSAASAQPGLPSFDEEIAVAARQEEPYTPSLSLAPLQRLTTLTEEESNMTVEEFIRREIELQYQQFREDGNRRIAQFKEKVAEARRVIEAA